MKNDDNTLPQYSTDETSGDDSKAPYLLISTGINAGNYIHEAHSENKSAVRDSVSSEQKKIPVHTIILTVLGGTLVMISLGIVTTWGAISVYITSYYREFDPSLTVAYASLVYPIQQITQVFLRPFTARIVQAIGFRMLLFIGSTVMGSSLIICSFSTSFVVFAICYGLIAGLSSGFVSTMPFWSSWDVLPNHKGAVSGLVHTGVALGALLFTVLGQVFANPQNNLPIPVPNSKEKYYEKEIADKVPHLLLYFGLVACALGLAAAIMIKSPATSGPKKNAQNQPAITFKRILTSNNFWVLNGMLLISCTPGIFTAGNYKFYGLTVPAIRDDSFLTLVGSTCAVVNGVGKIMSGLLMDKLSFKSIYSFLLVLQLILTLTLTYASESKVLFLIWVPLIYLVLGAHYVIAPVVCSKLYGSKLGFEAYGIVCSMFGFSTLAQYLLVQLGLEPLGFPTLLYILSGMSAVSLLMNIFLFKEEALEIKTKRVSVSLND